MKRPLTAIGMAACLCLSACTQLAPNAMRKPMASESRASITPQSEHHPDLQNLPRPKGQIVAAVYNFRDMTGQYKASPDSAYSTAVTQGAASMLVKAMLDSNWFQPVEREGLQNLLTERRIVRSQDEPGTTPSEKLPALIPASIVIEGGIVGFDSNVRTGGAGLRYLGVGASDEYRTDQVTINLRAVDIRSGRILASVSTSKTVYSMKLRGDIYRFVRFKELLEAEAGFTRNEPGQLCLQDAIEAGLIHLIAQGVRRNLWSLADARDITHPVLRAYLTEQGLALPPIPENNTAPKT